MAPKSTAITHKKSHSPMKQGILSFKSTKRNAAKRKGAKGKGKAVVKTAESEGEEESELGDLVLASVKEELDMKDKAGRYKRYYKKATEKMGWKAIKPIHAEDQTKIHKMLRIFDNSYEYGPCVGVTRIERWERAEAMGLNPPPEVREILLTRQGSEDVRLVHPVFYGLVL